jgi:general secretion pathway protein A
MIEQGKGFGVLTGEVGVGKTMLSRILLRSLERSAAPANTALILYPHLDEVELISTICDELGVPPAEAEPGALTNPRSLKAQLERLNRFLLAQARRGRKTVLVVDEAQHLPLGTLETIRLLTNLETERQKLLQMILIGQTELDALLAKPQIRQLSQRISVRETLRPFDAKEAELYIRHRLERAGGANFLRFDPEAIAWLNARTGGIPRLLNRECERLIAAAERNRVHLITRAFARKVLEPQRGLFGGLFERGSRAGGELPWEAP